MQKVLSANLTDKNFNRNHRKENHYQGSYIIVDKALNVKLDCRVYGTAAKNYACIWMSGEGRMYSGSGDANGYGYHRTSQAVGHAIKGMGIELQQPIEGRGDSAMEEALKAIAEYMNWGDVALIHTPINSATKEPGT